MLRNFLRESKINFHMLRNFILTDENDYKIQSKLDYHNYLAVEKATGNKILIKSFQE